MFLKHTFDYTRVHVLVESVVLLSLVKKDFSRVQKEEGSRLSVEPQSHESIPQIHL